MPSLASPKVIGFEKSHPGQGNSNSAESRSNMIPSATFVYSLHYFLSPLDACGDQLVRTWASLRPSEQIVSRLHVQARQNRCHDPDDSFAALVHVRIQLSLNVRHACRSRSPSFVNNFGQRCNLHHFCYSSFRFGKWHATAIRRLGVRLRSSTRRSFTAGIILDQLSKLPDACVDLVYIDQGGGRDRRLAVNRLNPSERYQQRRVEEWRSPNVRGGQRLEARRKFN